MERKHNGRRIPVSTLGSLPNSNFDIWELMYEQLEIGKAKRDQILRSTNEYLYLLVCAQREEKKKRNIERNRKIPMRTDTSMRDTKADRRKNGEKYIYHRDSSDDDIVSIRHPSPRFNGSTSLDLPTIQRGPFHASNVNRSTSIGVLSRGSRSARITGEA